MTRETYSSESTVEELREVEGPLRDFPSYKVALRHAKEREEPAVKKLLNYFELDLQNGKKVRNPEKRGFGIITINNDAEIKQLEADLLESINVRMLNGLLYRALNRRLKTPVTKSEAVSLACATSSLIGGFYFKEAEKTNNLAFRKALPWMLLIVTIPFIVLIFRAYKKQLTEQQTLGVKERTDEGLIETLNSTEEGKYSIGTFFNEKKKVRSNDQNGSYEIGLNVPKAGK